MKAHLAIVPSDRVSASEFLSILRESAIPVEVEGWGRAISSVEGRVIEDVVVIRLPKEVRRRVEIRADLCGIGVHPLKPVALQ